MQENIEILKTILNFIVGISWQIVILIIVIIFKNRLSSILAKLEKTIHRTTDEACELQFGDILKVSFQNAKTKINETTIKEDKVLSIYEEEISKSFKINNILKHIPLKQHHKDLLFKVAKGGVSGINWEYGGDPANAPGNTMGFLLKNSLVIQKKNKYFCSHKVIEEYIFKEYGYIK